MAATEQILQPRYFAETALYLRSASTMSPLHDACLDGDTERVRQLLDEGAPVDVKDKDGRTVLMKAILQGHTEVVRLLLDKGAAVEKFDPEPHHKKYIRCYQPRFRTVGGRGPNLR